MTVEPHASATANTQTPRRSLSRGAGLNACVRLLSLGTAAAVSIIVARLLGPAGSGRFALAAALFFTAFTLCRLGLDVGIGWLVGGGQWDAAGAFVAVQLAACAIGLLGGCCGFVAYRVLSESVFDGIQPTVAVSALAALPFALASAFAAQVALASERYEASVVIPGIQALTYVAAVAVLTGLLGLTGAVVGLLVSHVAAAGAGVVWAARARRVRMIGPVDVRLLRRAAWFGIQAHAANVLALLIYRFDLFFLAGYASASDVGYYAVALATTNVVILLPVSLSAVLLPRIAALAADDERGATAEVETRALRHTTIALSGTSVALLIALPLLIEPVYGTRFGPAVPLALILLPGSVALGFATVFYAALAGRGRPDFALKGTLATTPVALALYLLLIPPFHAIGAAVASTIAYVIAAVMAGLFTRRVTGHPVLPRLVPTSAEIGDYRSLVAAVNPLRRVQAAGRH